MISIRKVTTPTNAITGRDFLGGAAAAAGILAVSWPGLTAAEAQAALEPGQRKRIEAAIPTKAIAGPRRRRKLLIFDLNVGYGRLRPHKRQDEPQTGLRRTQAGI